MRPCIIDHATVCLSLLVNLASSGSLGCYLPPRVHVQAAGGRGIVRAASPDRRYKKLIHRRRSVHSSIRLSHHLRSQCRDETVLGRGSSEKILFIFFQRTDPAFSFSGFQDHFPAPASRPLPSTSFGTSLPDQLPDHSLRSLQTIPVDLPPDRFP